MVHFISRWLWPCALPAALLAGLCSSALTAKAQSAAPAARPDPLDPKASTPTLVYESPFFQYRRFGDEKPVPWRDANDTVTRIGGWRVYAREAQQPDPAPAPKPPANAPEAGTLGEMAKPMPPGHDSHKTP